MKNKLALCAVLCALVSMISASQQVMESCRYGLRLCAELILPSLFPFFVASNLLSRLGLPQILGRYLAPAAQRIYHISGAGATALLVGLCGGYPLGAAYLADLESAGQISKAEADRLLAFCNNSGPAFIVGAVGTGVFGSSMIGLQLYCVHIAAALTSGLLFRPERTWTLSASCRPEQALPLSQAIPEAVRQAVLSILNICGFVVCFTVFTGLLDTHGLFSLLAARLSAALGTSLPWSRALLCGFLELGSGAGALRGLPASPDNLALAAGLLGWGGLSVQFQSLSVLSESNINSALHVAGRLVSAVFSFVYAYLLFSWLF